MLRIIIFVLLFLSFPYTVKAETDNNRIYFSSQPNFSTYTTEFESNQSVYVKIVAEDIADLEGENTFQVLDSNSAEIISGTFSEGSNGVFTSSFVFPNNKDLYYLKVRVKDSGNNKFEIDTNLGSKYQFKKSKFFEDDKFKDENEEFENDQDIFYKGYLGDFENDEVTISVKSTKGEIKTINSADIVNRSDWIELGIYKGLNPFLYSKGLYSLIVENTETGKSLYKHFYISKLNPLVIINSPANDNEVLGIVDIIGTAFSEDIEYYKLKYQKNGDSDWTDIQSAETNKIIEKLGSWDTSTLSHGNYKLSLIVKSNNGEEKETSVKNLKVANFSGAFTIKVPTNAGLGSTKSSTSAQYILGKVGNSTSRGISVQDDRGTFDGWSLTMSASDFYSGGEVISVNNLTIEPKDLVTNKGSSEQVKLGLEHTFTDENDVTTVMYAEDGYGTGIYFSTLGIKLNVPPNIAAGKYNAVLYFTLL